MANCSTLPKGYNNVSEQTHTCKDNLKCNMGGEEDLRLRTLAGQRHGPAGHTRSRCAIHSGISDGDFALRAPLRSSDARSVMLLLRNAKSPWRCC